MIEVPRRYWRNFDWPLLIAVIALIAFGMLIIYSASFSKQISLNRDPFYYVKRQAIGAVIGFICLAAVLIIDYRAWRRWTKPIYLITIGLLGAIFFLGTSAYGSQRWIGFGPLTIQPSEIAKIALIVILAKYLEEENNIAGWKILIPFALVSIPMALILHQPDVGTSMIFIGITFSMLFLAGARVKHLVIIGLTGLAVGCAAIFASMQGWIEIIKPYQINRLLVFINPHADPTNTGWNVIQSMIAIGSGGFLGKGLFSGPQNQLRFLPANHTDFVFSVVAEELGFVGSVGLLLLYLFLIWRGLRIAILAKDSFGMLLAAGCTSMFFFHLIINVGMTLGIMPVTGLPLPFVTYGGNTLMTNLIAIGILLNVGLRRKKIMF